MQDNGYNPLDLKIPDITSTLKVNNSVSTQGSTHKVMQDLEDLENGSILDFDFDSDLSELYNIPATNSVPTNISLDQIRQSTTKPDSGTISNINNPIPPNSPTKSIIEDEFASVRSRLADKPKQDTKPLILSDLLEGVDSNDQTYEDVKGRKKEIEELSKDIKSTERTHFREVLIRIVLAIIGLLVVISIGKNLFKKSKSPVQNDPPPATNPTVPAPTGDNGGAIHLDKEDLPRPLGNSSIKVGTQLYSDVLRIEKIIELRDNTAVCYFKGVPKHFQEEVVIPVSTEIYNKYSENDSVAILYNITKFDGKVHVVNIKVKE